MVCIVCCSKRCRTLSGGIYLLPSETFVSYANRGMGINEWTSSVPVRPLCMLTFASVLKGMQALGTDVHFIDDALMKKACKENPHGPNWLLHSFMPDAVCKELE